MANDHDPVAQTPTIESLPDSPIAGQSAGQDSNQASASSVDFKKLFESPEFDEFIEKKVQSKQDKRLGQYGTKIESLEEAISQYVSLTGSTVNAEALNKMQEKQSLADMRAELEALKGGTMVAPSAGAGEKSWAEKQQAILDNAGIDKNDPRIVELLRASGSKQEFIANLEEKSFAWKKADVSKPQPSAGTVAQTIPSVPSGDGTYTKDKYKTDMLAARGKPNELARIKAAAKADGVDVDNIGFI